MPGDALTAEELDPHAALLEVQQRLPAVMLVENILWTSVLMLCLAPPGTIEAKEDSYPLF